ncbi:hypothetical protein RIF29_15262 [Crotalaria pallida]|uniref:Uncharacterized protein n=1 Tax=Crotalaria pallida TaxID=3830 RepID=A0AAN9FJU2_CROPI
MRTDRSWMLQRKDRTGIVREEFSNGVREFMNVVREHPSVSDRKGRIPCDGGQSSAIPTTEPQGSDPRVVPSSVDSRTDRTVRKNVLYVEPADDP